MVLTIALLEPHQHQQGGVGIGLLHLDQLEAALQRRIALEVLLVFRPGGGGHGADLATGQCGLEQVGGIRTAGFATGADQRVRLVDEQDDLFLGLAHRLQHVLQALLELTLHAGAGLQQAEVEDLDTGIAQLRWHRAAGDAQGQALDQGRLAHARLADEDGIVLAPAAEDVEHHPDLLVPAQHRVQPALAGLRGQIHGKPFQRFGGGRWRLAQALQGRCRRLHGAAGRRFGHFRHGRRQPRKRCALQPRRQRQQAGEQARAVDRAGFPARALQPLP